MSRSEADTASNSAASNGHIEAERVLLSAQDEMERLRECLFAFEDADEEAPSEATVTESTAQLSDAQTTAAEDEGEEQGMDRQVGDVDCLMPPAFAMEGNADDKRNDTPIHIRAAKLADVQRGRLASWKSRSSSTL
eukprot:54230-Prymnesium_polylepis.1